MKNSISYVAIFLLALAISGCSHDGSVSKKPLPDLYIVGIDRSSSTNPMRVAQINQLKQVVTAATINAKQVEFWTFDHRALCQWGPQVPSSPDALQPVEAKTLSMSNGSNRHITRPALMLQQIAQDPAFLRARSVTIILLTDGDNEVPSDDPLFTQQAAAIASHPSVHLAVLDINPENRPVWQKAFSALPPQNFLLAGDTQSTRTEDRFLGM